MKKLVLATHNANKVREIGESLPGFEVFALGGAPGVRSARYAGEDGNTPKNNALLLANMADIADRRAQYTCAMVLVAPDGTEHTAVGHCPGTILREQHGAGGFGYDPLFVPDGFAKTFAELAPGEMNAISHCGRALAEIRKILSLFARRTRLLLPGAAQARRAASGDLGHDQARTHRSYRHIRLRRLTSSPCDGKDRFPPPLPPNSQPSTLNISALPWHSST